MGLHEHPRIHGRVGLWRRLRARSRLRIRHRCGARPGLREHRALRPFVGDPQLIPREKPLEVVPVVRGGDLRIGRLQLVPPLRARRFRAAARGDSDGGIVLLDDVEAASRAGVALGLIACRGEVHPPGRDSPDRILVAVTGIRGEQIGRSFALARELLRDSEGRLARLCSVGARGGVDPGRVAHRRAVTGHRAQQACVQLPQRRHLHQEGLELPALERNQPDVQARARPPRRGRRGVVVLGDLLLDGGLCSGQCRRRRDRRHHDQRRSCDRRLHQDRRRRLHERRRRALSRELRFHRLDGGALGEDVLHCRGAALLADRLVEPSALLVGELVPEAQQKRRELRRARRLGLRCRRRVSFS